jgi:hypothetical protein
MYEWLLFAHLLGVAVLLAGLGDHVVSVDRLRQAARVIELRALLATAKCGSGWSSSGLACSWLPVLLWPPDLVILVRLDRNFDRPGDHTGSPAQSWVVGWIGCVALSSPLRTGALRRSSGAGSRPRCSRLPAASLSPSSSRSCA